MNKIKISNFQLLALSANFTIGSTVITIQSGIAELAKQDAWICALISPAVGLLFIWIYYTLGRLYPDQTIVDIFRSAFGKWIGWIVSGVFVLFVCLLSSAQVTFYIGNFKQTQYMTETPLYALNALFVILLVLGLLYGVETIARSSELFLYIITFMIVFAMAMSIPNVKPTNLLPVLEKGLVPVLKGSVRLSSFLTWPFVVLSFVYPLNTEQNKKARNSMMIGYLWASLINFICTIMSILVLGPIITERSQYPIYLLAQEINVGIISRIEGVVSLSWILTEFIRSLMYFYAAVIGISQLFGLKDHKKIALPLALIVLVLSGIVYPNTPYQTTWDTTTWVAMIGSFGVVLPVLALFISLFKKQKNALR